MFLIPRSRQRNLYSHLSTLHGGEGLLGSCPAFSVSPICLRKPKSQGGVKQETKQRFQLFLYGQQDGKGLVLSIRESGVMCWLVGLDWDWSLLVSQTYLCGPVLRSNSRKGGHCKESMSWSRRLIHSWFSNSHLIYRLFKADAFICFSATYFKHLQPKSYCSLRCTRLKWHF